MSTAFRLLIILSLLFLPLGATAQPAGSAEPSSNLLVKLVSGLTVDQQAEVIARNGGIEISSIPVLRVHVIVVPTDFARVLAAYQADPQVQSVEMDKTRTSETLPNDPLYAYQWALPKIGWDQAFGTFTPTVGVKVAVLDTGVDASHPDLAGNVLPGISILDGSDGTSDPSGHGTWLAGIIAAQTDSAAPEGIAAVAYAGVRIMPVTVLNANGEGQDSDVIAGVVWAADHGADVILMAFSAPDFSPTLQDAIDYAWSKGAVVVAAVGNNALNAPTFPAGDRGVMGVSATDPNDALAWFSNSGQAVFIAAPGVDIQTIDLNGNYIAISGTSAAAAHVAGLAALLKAVDPSATNGVIVGRIARNADPAGPQEQTGNGRINLARALADTSTDPVQPAGADPLGQGGPYVGPYRAAPATSITLGSQIGTLTYGSTGSATFAVDPDGSGNTNSSVTVTWTAGVPVGVSTSPSSFGPCNLSQSSCAFSLTVNTTAATPAGAATFRVSWSNAISNVGTLTVGPKSVTASITAADKTYDRTSAATIHTCTVAGKVGSDDVTCVAAGATFADANAASGKTVTATGITLTGTAASRYVLISTTATTTASITPKTVTASVTAADKTYDGTTAAAIGTCSLSGVLAGDGGAVTCTAASATFTDASVGDGKAVTATGITLSGVGAGNYALSLPSATTTASILRALLTVTADNKSREYGDPNPMLTASYSGFQNGETLATSGITGSPSLTTTAAQTSPVNGSPYAITAAVGTLAATNYSFVLVNGQLTITKAALTVSADDATRAYGAANPTFTATYSGFKNGETLPTSGVTGSPSLTTLATPISPVSGGPYTIVAALGSLASPNYSFAFVNGQLAVTGATLTVAADDTGREYGDDNPVFTATITGFQNGETLPTSGVTGTAACSSTAVATSSVVGSPYPITCAIGTLAASNYTFAFTAGQLTVTRATVTVSVDDKSRTYGDTNPVFTASYSGFKNGETLLTSGVTGSPDLTTTAVPASPVSGGPYPITAAIGTLTAGNYTFAFVHGQLTVLRREASVMPDPKSKTYGGVDPALTGTLSGFLDADGVTATYSRTAGETVAGSPYTISATLSPAGVLANYTITSSTAAFTINKKVAAVTPNAQSKTYGAADPLLTGTASGFVAVDGVTATYSRTPGETVAGGPYTISATLSPAAVLDNYDITYNTAPFTITKANPIVTAAGSTCVYSAMSCPGSGGAKGVLDEGLTPVTLSYAVTPGPGPLLTSAPVAAGTYFVTAHYAGDANYNPAQSAPAAITISKKAASVTPYAHSKTYGAADPVLTGTTSGFVAVDGVTATYSRTPGETVAAGPYTIGATLSPAAALDNYDVTYNTAPFTITQRAAWVTPEAASKIQGSPDPMLTGTLGGFLPGDGVAAAYARTAGETIGTYTISATLNPVDVLGNYAITYGTAPFTILYNWTGFLQPIDNLPVVNVVKAGSAVPVKFRLHGNQGLGIFAPGFPASGATTCNSIVSIVDETVTAGSSSLTYDAGADQYVYVWKTEKAWTGCRQLVIQLKDGSYHRANFQFK